MTTLLDLMQAVTLNASDQIILRQTGTVADRRGTLSLLASFLFNNLAFQPAAPQLDVFAGLIFLDEDDMSSDSPSAVPSQQSVKAYADGVKAYADDILPALGAANQVLQVNSAGDALEYGSVEQANLSLIAPTSDLQAATKKYVDDEIAEIPAPDSGWVPLQTQTVSSAVASVDFTSGIDSTYKAYVIVVTGLVPTTGAVLFIRTSTDGGSSYDSGASDYGYSLRGGHLDSTTGTNSVSDGDSRIRATGETGIGNSAEAGYNGFITLYNPSETEDTLIGIDCVFQNSLGQTFYYKGVGVRLSAADVDAIRFLLSSGNIASGTLTLYGIAGA